MTSYQYPPPNARIHGAALKITNTSTIVNGIYSGSGIFLDDGENRFPLITAGKEDLVTIPEYSTIYLYQYFDTPILLRENVRIVVDSTSLPNTCVLQPSFLLEMD